MVRAVARSTPAVRAPVLPATRSHARARNLRSHTRWYRSSKRQPGSAAAQRCSLVCISRTCSGRTTGTSRCTAGVSTPASSGIAVPFHSLPAAALRHVRGFPALGLLRRLRPIPDRSADGGPSPDVRAGCAARGGTGTFPVFACDRLSEEAPGYTPAASPRLRRSPSPWPCAAANETSAQVACPSRWQTRTAPSPDPSGSSWWEFVTRLHTPVPLVHLSVVLAGHTAI